MRANIKPLPLNFLTDEEKLAYWPTIRHFVQRFEKNLEESMEKYPDGYHAKINGELHGILEYGMLDIAKRRERALNPTRLEAFNDRAKD
jgi:hypothetical protein